MTNQKPKTTSRSLSRQIAAYIAAISGAMLIIASLVIYLVILKFIATQDQNLIETKASFVTPHIKRGDIEDIKTLLSTRYPQDLPKRLYVVVYDETTQSVARTFNTGAISLADIFPPSIGGIPPLGPGESRQEPQTSVDGRTFSVSTRAYLDQYGRRWVVRIAVDHDADAYLNTAIEISFAAILFVAFILVPLSSALVSRLITKPLGDVTRHLSKMVPGKTYPHMDEDTFPRELRSLVQAFNNLSKDAEIAFERLQSFSSDISHELRNPLSSMRVNLELLLSRERTVPEYTESIGSLLDDTVRLTGLVESLLFLLRGERQLIMAELKKIDILTLLTSIADMYRPVIEDDGGTFDVDCPTGLTIVGEPRLLQRAIVNLVENAIKYGKPQDGTPAKITLSAAVSIDNPDIKEIRVQDNGPGVPDSELPFVFDRLFRSDRSRNSGGYGLGLAIVRMIIGLHGGVISARKTPGDGCCFIIAIPKNIRPDRFVTTRILPDQPPAAEPNAP